MSDFTSQANRCRGILTVMLLAVLLGGCEQEGIRVYEAPKDPPQRQTAEASGASGPMQAPSAQQDAAPPPMDWQAPEHWQASSQQMPMRLATYYADQGADADEPMEVAISAFPGEAGGALANVNRWREQLDLPPITQAELEPMLHSFGQSGQVHGYTLRIDPPADTSDAQGMLAAIIHAPDHRYTWFVRAFGQPAQLQAHQADLRAFAQTFHMPQQPVDHAHDHGYGDPSQDAGPYTQQADESDTTQYDSPHATASTTRDQLVLEKPEGWRAREGTSSIVYATFEAGPPERSASIAVTPLAGDAGGLFANVNMWRQQIGLPGLEDEDQQPVEPIDVDGRQGQLVSAESDVASFIAVVLPDGDQTWFFRISGPREVVDQQRDHFERFVRQARFREP